MSHVSCILDLCSPNSQNSYLNCKPWSPPSHPHLSLCAHLYSQPPTHPLSSAFSAPTTDFLTCPSGGSQHLLAPSHQHNTISCLSWATQLHFPLTSAASAAFLLASSFCESVCAPVAPPSVRGGPPTFRGTGAVVWGGGAEERVRPGCAK